MTTWVTAPGYVLLHRAEILALCEATLGREHKRPFSPRTGKHSDNHGNWRVNIESRLQFRYEKDLMWFLMVGAHLLTELAYKSPGICAKDT